MAAENEVIEKVVDRLMLLYGMPVLSWQERVAAAQKARDKRDQERLDELIFAVLVRA